VPLRATFASYGERRIRRIETWRRTSRYQKQRRRWLTPLRQYKHGGAQREVRLAGQASETRLRHFDEATMRPSERWSRRSRCARRRSVGKHRAQGEALSIPDLLNRSTARSGLASAWRSLVEWFWQSHFLRLIAGLPCANEGELHPRGAGERRDISRNPRPAGVHWVRRCWTSCRGCGPGSWRRRWARCGVRAGSTLGRGLRQAVWRPAARLQICCWSWAAQPILALDEPTDNLDVASAEALERALAAYAAHGGCGLARPLVFCTASTGSSSSVKTARSPSCSTRLRSGCGRRRGH